MHQSERIKAQLRLDKCSIDILCSNPYCRILSNKLIPYKIITTTNDEYIELITNRCEHCGNITTVTISIKAGATNIKSYKNVKVNDLIPRSDTIHSNICISCTNFRIRTELYYPCDRCRHTMLWSGFGEDYYEMMK